MPEFFLNNGKIGSLQPQSGSTIKADDEFLKKYDVNNNSVWDSDEIQQFMQDLYSADVDGDGVISQNESISWFAKVTNSTVDKVRAIFQAEDTNLIYQALDTLIKENTHKQAVSRIRQNAQEGLDIYNASVGGVISKGYNSIKELFNTEYAGDKVYRQLVRQYVSSLLLEKAESSDGLTAREYIETKVSLLKSLLGADKFPAGEQERIEDAIKDLDIKEIDVLITKLSNAENDEFSNLQKQTIDDIKTKSEQNNNKELGFVRFSRLKSFLSSSNADGKMSFEQIFELENGVSFNQEHISKYEEQYTKTNAIVAVYNKVSEVSADLDKNISALEGYNKLGNTSGLANEREILYQNLSHSVLMSLQKFYGDDKEKINEILAQYDAKLEGGKITFNTPGMGDYLLVDMAKNLLANIQGNLNKLMDGKTIEDYQTELEEAYENAYGTKNAVDLASKFQKSQQEGVGYTKLGVSLGGVALIVLSNGTLLPVLSGTVLSIAGGGIVSGVEAATKEGGMTKEDAKEIAKEIASSGVLTLLGMKQAEIAAKIGHTLLKSCPKLLQYTAEYGSMAVMGALTNYAVMGDINLSQEAISNLINIATGIAAHKKMLNNQAKIDAKPNKSEVNSETEIIAKLTDKVKKSNDIENVREEVINSSEFKNLPPEKQAELETRIADIAEVKRAVPNRTDAETEFLINIKAKRNCPTEDIKRLSDYLDKYPNYKNEILDIVNSNNNVKFGEGLSGTSPKHIDEIVKLLEQNPNYKDKIVDYMKVQRRADSDTSDPVYSVSNYIETLNKYPEHESFIIELSKNGNLDAKSTDGGINTIEAALNLYLKDGYKKEDILILSKQNYSIANMRASLATVERYPELRDIILKEGPDYKLIDETPANTPTSIIEERFKIKEQLEVSYADEMKKLRQTLGEYYFMKVRWEEIIPPNATPKEIKSILDSINESSKFFARTASNEGEYGKNIQWASKMNDISNGAEYLIKNGKEFDDVLGYIAREYRGYDTATSLETNHSQRNDRRLASGKYRGDDNPDDNFVTPFDGTDSYSEYFTRLIKVKSPRKPPYDDMTLTQIEYYPQYDKNFGRMIHPENKYVEPALNHVRERYQELQPFIDKVKSGQQLSKQDVKLANEKIAEIYFLMANSMPYERGSNGISDILMRSLYKSLGIEQPALKHGVSLDLEAFCMDLNEYKKKWSSFFENN